jgi:hypothetical protein
MTACGTFRTSQDVRLESAKWAKADTDQVTVTNCDFMSTRPKERRALVGLVRVRPAQGVLIPPGPGDAGGPGP